jgi:hypothetical protein
MYHSETDIVTGSFVAAARVTDESGELDDGKVPGVGIFIQDPNDTPATECATGGTASEYLSGVMDSESANRTEAVATEEGQLTPPMRSSATQNAKAPRTKAASARNARAWNRFLRERIGF